ncbi:hypothetical protein GGP66_000217 [Salinibacter ruber]|nr:hypothetical protein [Salinibacter ruber]
MIGQLVPVVTFHLANQDLPASQYEALCGSLRRGIDIYLSGEYNSRFRALENWWRAPDQIDRLHHVVRRGSRPRPERFVYKEPFLSLAPEFALDALPNAKLIYIYRDGRDVANSLVESYNVLTDQELTHLRSAEMRTGRRYDERYVPWWVAEGRDEEFIENPPYIRAIWMWAYMARRCHTYLRSVPNDDQVLYIRYEQFMRRPQTVGQKLLDHLGATETRAFRRHLRRARTSSIGKHERRSSEELTRAVEVAGDVLEAHGYV